MTGQYPRRQKIAFFMHFWAKNVYKCIKKKFAEKIFGTEIWKNFLGLVRETSKNAIKNFFSAPTKIFLIPPPPSIFG